MLTSVVEILVPPVLLRVMLLRAVPSDTIVVLVT